MEETFLNPCDGALALEEGAFPVCNATAGGK
jgi:hypothetical protein